jgi:hypothetical protein
MLEGSGSPFLTGAFRPAIVLPASLLSESPAAVLELMLAHELAHLKRRDLPWGWLPAVMQALFWFHPLVWLAGPEWRLAQEMACDELAMWAANAPPGDYGEVLLNVAAQGRAHVAGGLITVGVLESYHTLQRRLIAMKSIGQVSSRQIAVMGMVLAALGVVGFVPWRVTAQTGGKEANDKVSIDSMNRETQFRLKQLANALTLYAEDWDAALPPMKDAVTVRRALLPYVRKNDEVLIDPRTNEPYQPNPSLSGKRPANVVDRLRRAELDAIAADVLRHPNRRPPARVRFQMRWDISSPQNTVAFYEPAPAPDGTRAVVFLDHHVARVPEAQWPEMKRIGGVP